MSVWMDIHKRSNGDLDRKEDVLEMVYGPRTDSSQFEVLARGTYRDVRYACISRKTHPCAYVFCDKEFLDNHMDEWRELDCISVHGGVTYVGPANDLIGFGDYPDDVYCFGWDYAHCGDWSGYESKAQNEAFCRHKYTTNELIKECKSAIDQYLNALE